jgi:hypothetical protein
VASSTTIATSPTTLAQVDTRILVYSDCQRPTLEPTEIVLTCADYGWLLEGLRWTTWTATEATATGTFVYNDCVPYCAAGHHHQVPGTQVTLTRPVRGAGGHLLWSRLQQSPQPSGYTSGPLRGAPFPLPMGPI